MKAETVPAYSFRCGLSQCSSFARAVPVIAHALRKAAAKGTRTPAPPTGLSNYAAAEACAPFIPSIG